MIGCQFEFVVKNFKISCAIIASNDIANLSKMWASIVSYLGYMSTHVHMETVLSWFQSGDFGGDLGLAIGIMQEFDKTLDLGISLGLHLRNSIGHAWFGVRRRVNDNAACLVISNNK